MGLREDQPASSHRSDLTNLGFPSAFVPGGSAQDFSQFELGEVALDHSHHWLSLLSCSHCRPDISKCWYSPYTNSSFIHLQHECASLNDILDTDLSN